MAKIQTFKVKAKVVNGKLEVDYLTKKMESDGTGTDFDESRIALKAQEVAEANKSELEMIKSFGDGDYELDFKLIV